MLMNGSAVCQMHMGQFEEAEASLLEALNKVHTAYRSDYLTTLASLYNVFFLTTLYLPALHHQDYSRHSVQFHIFVSFCDNLECFSPIK